SRFDFRFGLRETLHGLSRLSGRLLGPYDLSRLTALAVLIYLVARWRYLDRPRMVLGAILMVVPLLFATSFRSDFPGAGAWSRYAFLPTVGASIWLGQAVLLPPPRPRPRWLRAPAVALIAIIAYAGLIARSAWKNAQCSMDGPREL